MKPFKISLITIFTLLLMLLNTHLFPDKPETDETIILPSTYGWFMNGELNVSIHAWIFELEEDSVLRNSIINLLKDQYETAGVDEKKNFEERVRFFLADNHRGKDITINIAGVEHSLPKTLPDGHTLTTIKIRDTSKLNSTGGIENFSTLHGKDGTKTFSGNFQIIGEKGLSIISDIDDTIKESNVLDKKDLVKNTFFRKFRSIDGMSQLYKKFEKKGAVFHYVSGSPWQLYPVINTFISEEQFPFGAIELKQFRVKDRSLISFISADQQSYKKNAISTIMNRFPEREFILIGDSGEKDPEVYTEIADLYKGKIKYIFIRDAGLIEEGSSRRKAIIAKAGTTKIVIFKNTVELYHFADEL